MVKKPRVRAADLRGVNRLTIAGIAGVVDLVEAMHHTIAIIPRMIARPKQDRTTGITRLVYRSIHGVVGLVGHGLDGLLARLAPCSASAAPGPGARRRSLRSTVCSATTWLHRTTRLRSICACVGAVSHCLTNASRWPRRSRRLTARWSCCCYGLCMNDLQWKRKGHDHGAALARDLAYTPVYLHYNSGLLHLHERARVRGTARNPGAPLARAADRAGADRA